MNKLEIKDFKKELVIPKGDELNIDCEWKKISKPLKKQFISDYISTMVIKYNLDSKEKKQFTYQLELSINNFHTIADNDIKYENGKIIKIRGIKFSKKKRVFIMPETCRVHKKGEKNSNTSKVYTMYDKFIKESFSKHV